MQENGSGVQRWRFTGTALLSTEIKKQVQNNKFFRNAVIKDQFKEGDYILDATLNFKNVDQLKNADRDVKFESEGWLFKTYSYTEVWKRSGDPAGLLAQHARGVVPVTLRVSVALPGRIGETNAHMKDGSTAEWSIPVSDLAAMKVLTAKSRSWNWPILIISLFVIGTALAGGAYALYSQFRKSKLPAVPPTSCPACGAIVPAGSAFCNFCGNKMANGK